MTLPDREGASGWPGRDGIEAFDAAEARRDERKRLLLAGFLGREFTPQAR